MEVEQKEDASKGVWEQVAGKFRGNDRVTGTPGARREFKATANASVLLSS